MAKRRHPTPKTLRQGQTIHIVSRSLTSFNGPCQVVTYHLHSHKTPMPPLGCVIERMPVDHLRPMLDHFGSDIFYSRRRAVSECNRRNRLGFVPNEAPL